MGILIRDPGADAAAEAEYQKQLDAAMLGKGEWPKPPVPTEEEKAYANSIASSERVYRNFTRLGQGQLPMEVPSPREQPPVLDESPGPRPATMQQVPFTLKDGGK